MYICKACDFLVLGTNFKSRVTGRNYVNSCSMDCNSNHVIYLTGRL